MIDIRRVTIRNFLSYGNYDTVIDFTALTQCYISGSNGAGKSSLLQAILWCLSGSTMHAKVPGSRIRHWWSEADTVVTIEFMDGSELTRIRTSSDHTELLFRQNGEDVLKGTLSTTSNHQTKLNRLLKFDPEIFCGSVFLSQYRQGWLKMGDQHRKSIFERIMGIDRINTYAMVSKQEYDKVALKAQGVMVAISNQRTALAAVQAEAADVESQQRQFRTDQATKAANKVAQADKLAAEVIKASTNDIPTLKAKWAIVEKVGEKITAMRVMLTKLDEEIDRAGLRREQAEAAANAKIRVLRAEMAKVTAKLTPALDAKRKEFKAKRDAVSKINDDIVLALTGKILYTSGLISAIKQQLSDKRKRLATWTELDGTTCDKCEQGIEHEHAESQITECQASIVSLEENQQELTEALDAQKSEQADIKKQHADDIEILENNLNRSLNEITAANVAEVCEVQEQIDAAEASKPAPDNAQVVKRNELATKIKEAEAKLEASKPTLTVAMAEVLASKHDLVQKQIADLRQEADACLQEPDPHNQHRERLTKKEQHHLGEIALLEKQLSASELVSEHAKYVYKSYSDRRKIKGQLIAENRPYVNDRIGHYLNSIGLDIRIKLSEGLALESDLWGHEFQSGGEQARADLAMAFGSFDLHESIHGPQSNFMVLDEPDDGLDEAGIQGLINIIRDDLASRFKVIFIISHRDAFRNTFPNSIVVAQENRLSRIVEVV